MIKKYLRRIFLNRWAAFIHDLFWIPVAIFLAFLFRFNLQGVPDPYLQGCISFSLVAVPVYSCFFWFFGLYRGIWRFVSLPDFARIINAACLGCLTVSLVAVVLLDVKNVPRTVLFLSPMLLIAFLLGSRLGYRFFKDRRLQLQRKEGKRTLIVGAGHAGDLLLRDLLTRQEYQPVALVDDDKKKQGCEIHGIRVYGQIANISELTRVLDIELVLFAIPSAHKKIVNQLISECAKAGVEFKTLPSIYEKTSGRVEVGQLRPITLDDLLGREPVVLDEKAISGYLSQKTVLVTGGGGSIGSELCRQVAGQHPKRLIVFDHGEFNLYSIEYELRSAYPDLVLESVLGDVKNYDRVDWVFKELKPDVVFHAAAYKHVPMVEYNPAEGVSNNVGGSMILADAAHRYNVDRFVFISTDKAVNPANVMGTTKRIAEIFCQNLADKSNTKFITTRFGNVLGSAGSVVPLFEKQIKAGGPVTVTHRDISRYFMTIPEAVSLILQAGSMGKGGEIFVLDMGEPVVIRDLAKQMIRLSGLDPDKDIKIIYTGLRPGEKLYEEIFHERENLQGTRHPKLFLAGSRKCDWKWLVGKLAELEQAAKSRNVPELISHLRQIVPEYEGPHLSDGRAENKTVLKVVRGK